MFGRTTKKDLDGELAAAEQSLAELGALDIHELEQRRAALSVEVVQLEQRLESARAEVVETDEIQILQLAGIYDYRHPAEDSNQLKLRLESIKTRKKQMVKDEVAVTAAGSWTVNNSAAEGRKMIKDLATLMLQSYNSQQEALVKNMKGARVEPAIKKIDLAAKRIKKLASFAQIEISDTYHRISIEELEVAADYQEMLAEEKEREREEKARLREEEKARRELAKESERLAKERAHYISALAALESGEAGESNAEVQRLREKLGEIDEAIEGVHEREANTRAGYVYVISNLGSMGDGVVKIGMTRRLDPMDRVKELGDASVPFNFDVHALVFSKDAVGLETALHQAFADQRVNKVNMRREFFYVTPSQVRAEIEDRHEDSALLHFVEDQEAAEYRQSWGEAPPPVVASVGDGQDDSQAEPPLLPPPPSSF